MPTEIKWRRGNTAQTTVFTGALAEVTVDTDKKTLVVHDGVTAGGFPLAREDATTASFEKANLAFSTPSETANYAYLHANSAFDFANTVAANAGIIIANGAFVQANAAYIRANNSLDANNGGTVAGNVAILGSLDVTGEVIVSGNLTITGETVFNNTETVLIRDNTILLNSDVPQDTAPSENAGIEINRGDSSNVSLLWNETTDKWVANTGTEEYNIGSDAASLYANGAFIQANAAYEQSNTIVANSALALEQSNIALAQSTVAYARSNGLVGMVLLFS